MTASELIARLQDVPLDADLYLYDRDGCVVMQAEWLKASGQIIATWNRSTQFTDSE